MRLTEVQSRELSRVYGAYVTEACDRCGAALGPIRWTLRDKPGAWCSQKCRDGIERQAGVCQGCGTSLKGMRKHAKFCTDTCRKRQRVRDVAKKPETPIQNKGLTGTISPVGHGATFNAEKAEKAPAIEF
jgi:hypothetical protein